MTQRLNILTHHKCASMWLKQYVSEFSETNSRSLYHSHYSREFPEDPFDIIELTNASYDFIRDKMDNGLHIIRNPLDIVVSAYFSHLSTHSAEGWPQLVRQRKILESAPRDHGLFLTLAFLERDDFYDGAVGPLHALRHWDYADDRFVTLRMEDVVERPQEVLGALFTSTFPDSAPPAASRYTFEAMAGRKPGDVDNNSHYRSGRRNQWRETLPAAIVDYVRAHYEPVLDRFYPDDANCAA